MARHATRPPRRTRPALNQGLPERPQTLDLETPRTALETFLAAAEEERWGVAAHVLDLTEVAPEDHDVAGPALARQLHSILERKILIRWSRLPDRPDGMIERGGSNDPMVGERRRSLQRCSRG